MVNISKIAGTVCKTAETIGKKAVVAEGEKVVKLVRNTPQKLTSERAFYDNLSQLRGTLHKEFLEQPPVRKKELSVDLRKTIAEYFQDTLAWIRGSKKYIGDPVIRARISDLKSLAESIKIQTGYDVSSLSGYLKFLLKQ